MNKQILLVGGIVLVALITLPLVLGEATGHVEGERRFEDLENRWRNYQVPEYAERMGLDRLSREFFRSRPLLGSYDEIMLYLGYTGTRIEDPADLPPTTWTSDHSFWASRVESPEYDLYIWINEYDCPMVIIFQDGKPVYSTAGMHPDGIRVIR